MGMAFIAGAVLGGLFGGFLMGHFMSLKAYKRSVEENRRIQRIIDEQYRFGVQIGEMNMRSEMSKQNAARDNMLVTAGIQASHMESIGTIDVPCGTGGDYRVAGYIANIVDNYIISNNDMQFDEYIETLLKDTFGGK